MSTITQAQQQAITDWLATHELPSGLGTKEAACSIAAINLALTGELTDRIPDCMSTVIGRWVIRTQDALPHAIRNSAEWKRLLPFAAGTGRARETERRALILDWLWSKALPEIQHIADARGFGDAWRQMCVLKTADSARSARIAADGADGAYAAYAAYAAAADADAAAAAAAAAVAVAADADGARLQFWQKVDPCALLAKLIEVV